MWELIRFSLEKRFLSKVSIIVNVVMFAVFGLAVHADYLFPVENGMVEAVYLDDSVKDYYSYFLKMKPEGFTYHIGNNAEIPYSAIIHLDEDWTVYSSFPLDSQVMETIRSDIRNARAQHYYDETDMRTRMFIDEYLSQTVINKVSEKEEESSNVWLVLSVVYFLIMTYGSMIANEVIYEKATNTLSIIMTSVEPEEHFWAKVITGYLSLFSQMLITVIYGLFWMLIRALTGSFTGLSTWLAMMAASGEQPVEEVQISFSTGLVSALLIIIGIVTIQILIMMAVCAFRNSEDAAGFQGPFYIVLMFIYYYLLVNADKAYMTAPLAKIVSYCPVLSVVFMPCRLFLNDCSSGEGFLAFIIAAVFLTGLVKWYIPVYKRQILR